MAARFPSLQRRPSQTGLKRRLRAVLRERDGDNCCHCDEPMDFGIYSCEVAPPSQATIEHFYIPYSVGGPLTEENCRLACRGCNQALGRRWQRYRTSWSNLANGWWRLVGWPALVEAE